MPYYGWHVAAIVVLAVTGSAWFLRRDISGYIGGAAWFLLLFLPAIGLRKVTELAARGEYQSARKLAAALQILHPTAEVREQVRFFQRLESHPTHGRAFSAGTVDHERTSFVRRIQRWNAPGVLILISANLLAFLFEVSVGGWAHRGVLHRLGALEPHVVVAQHEYWRLFSALFLHAGFLHLGFNLFALYILGPPLERAIGTIRFLACYLISGVASSAGVVFLNEIGLVNIPQLVGASGCIMGIVGTWAGFLLRNRHAPMAKERLSNIALIVVIQVAFDLSTPQVSTAAHMCGLIAGFFLGLILAPRATTASHILDQKRVRD